MTGRKKIPLVKSGFFSGKKSKIYTVFVNRKLAGQQLAEKLTAFKNKKDVLILAIPRGGVVVGKEVAKSLNAPLTVIGVKKLGAPQNPELGIGAVAEEKTVVWNKHLIQELEVNNNYKQQILSNKYQELKEQVKKFRGSKPLELANKTVILVDDGIATGLTIEAAIAYLRQKQAAKIVLAIPVCAQDAFFRLKGKIDSFICLQVEPELYAVGQFYEEFEQVSDEEVEQLLNNYSSNEVRSSR